QLLADLGQMVFVDVRVAEGVDELADAQVRDLCQQVRQQRITGDVERHAEEKVGRALVQLARQLTLCHVELCQGVTGRRAARPGNGGWVPGSQYQPPSARMFRIGDE